MTVFKVRLVIYNDIKREKEIKKETKKKERAEKKFCFKHYIYIMTKHNIYVQSRA
jgi:hypothetical protein